MSVLDFWAKEIAIIRKATNTLDEIYDNIMPENLVAMIEELVDELGSLQDDAALGALVRQMPVDSEFYRDETEEWRIVYRSEGDWHYRICTTPEAALNILARGLSSLGLIPRSSPL